MSASRHAVEGATAVANCEPGRVPSTVDCSPPGGANLAYGIVGGHQPPEAVQLAAGAGCLRLAAPAVHPGGIGLVAAAAVAFDARRASALR